MYARETEIRHLTSADVYALAVILDQTESWKKLMRIIPKDLNAPPENAIGKYTADHMRLIENASIRQNRSSTEILIDEWGTSGKRRATIWDLRELLVRAELYRAADFVSRKFLNEAPPPRPKTGPAARVDISLPPLNTQEMQQVQGELENMTYPESSAIQRNAVVRTNLNNEDFFEKLGPCRNKVCVEKSDMIKFSMQGEASTKPCGEASPALEVSDMIKFSRTSDSLRNIPSISTLLTESGESKENREAVLESNESCSESTSNDSTSSSTSKADIPAISTLLVESSESIRNRSTPSPNSSASTTESETTEEINSSEHNIPMLTALHGPSTSRSNVDNTPNLSVFNNSIDLPDLSAFNLGSESRKYEATNSAIVSARNFNLPNLSAITGNSDTEKVYVSRARIPNLSMVRGTQRTDEIRDTNADITNSSISGNNAETATNNANIPNLSLIGADVGTSNSYASDESLQPNLSIFNNVEEEGMNSKMSGAKFNKSEGSHQSNSSHNVTEEYIPELSILKQ